MAGRQLGHGTRAASSKDRVDAGGVTVKLGSERVPRAIGANNGSVEKEKGGRCLRGAASGVRGYGICCCRRKRGEPVFLGSAGWGGQGLAARGRRRCCRSAGKTGVCLWDLDDGGNLTVVDRIALTPREQFGEAQGAGIKSRARQGFAKARQVGVWVAPRETEMVVGRRALKQMGAVWELRATRGQLRRPRRPVKAGGGPRPGARAQQKLQDVEGWEEEGLPRALGPPPAACLLAWLLSGGQWWCVSPHLHAQSEIIFHLFFPGGGLLPPNPNPKPNPHALIPCRSRHSQSVCQSVCLQFGTSRASAPIQRLASQHRPPTPAHGFPQ